MTWHTEWLTDRENWNTLDNLRKSYGSDYFVTLDRLPFITES